MTLPVMQSESLFKDLSTLNRWSILFFILAKLSGAFGVCLGFMNPDYRHFGGYFLSAAVISIFLSICLALRQTFLDRDKFEKEDRELTQLQLLTDKKKELEKEICELEERYKVVNELKFRKSVINNKH